MSFKVNKLFRKWSCFGGKASTPEDEAQHRLRLNQPKIVITECKSSSPTISRKSSNSSSSDGMANEEAEVEIMLTTDEEMHKMGLSIEVKSRKLDQVDGNDNEDSSLVRVTDVDIGSFAHGFGIRRGDVISKVNGKFCDGDILDVKEAFLLQGSEDLQMEILRKNKNIGTGDTEILKMTISNARRIGGITVDELEIIKVASNWSLSDSSVYFQQEERKYLLQFASAGPQWVANDSTSDSLTLKRNLSRSEVETSAKFCIRVYFSWPMPESGYPVVIQHVHTGLCVALVNNDIKLVEVSQLEEVTDRSILFIDRVAHPDAGGSNKTFQSMMNKSLYIGFDSQRANAYAKPINVSPWGLGDKEKNVVFITTEV